MPLDIPSQHVGTMCKQHGCFSCQVKVIKLAVNLAPAQWQDLVVLCLYLGILILMIKSTQVSALSASMLGKFLSELWPFYILVNNLYISVSDNKHYHANKYFILLRTPLDSKTVWNDTNKFQSFKTKIYIYIYIFVYTYI